MQLKFHPTRHFLLLSGSTDGLVNLYNTSVTDEDDALYQVINHGSVHHADFIADQSIYALSHDETFAIHPLNSPDEAILEAAPTLFGDIRTLLDCEYAIQGLDGAQGSGLAVGNHS
jgi:WD repeat-containing protein 89